VKKLLDEACFQLPTSTPALPFVASKSDRYFVTGFPQARGEADVTPTDNVSKLSARVRAAVCQSECRERKLRGS
jgi:hypothetical protein